jgi:hypothetical protein
MDEDYQGILLLICQNMKMLLTRQEQILMFSQAAFEVLKRRLPLERDDSERLRILQKQLDDAQTPEVLRGALQKLDDAILALNVPQKNS